MTATVRGKRSKTSSWVSGTRDGFCDGEDVSHVDAGEDQRSDFILDSGEYLSRNPGQIGNWEIAMSEQAEERSGRPVFHLKSNILSAQSDSAKAPDARACCLLPRAQPLS